MNNVPLVIAEMSGNHNQSLERALRIVDAAADSGAHAIKLQTYTAESMTLNLQSADFVINDPNSLWYKDNLYSLYQKAATPYEWHSIIFQRCQERKIMGFSTPFDCAAVDFLETLNVPMYKVAAFENGDIPLLKYIAATRKPVIMSLGMIQPDEIAEAVAALQDNGCPQITLLKCTSTYPSSPQNSNLLTIADLKKRFPQCVIGLSDHTLGIGVAIGAVALGAEVIEKHFTLNRADGGVDSAFSIEPAELKLLVTESAKAAQARGKVCYELSKEEQQSLVFRRSVYVVANIKAGEKFTSQNIRCIRPGYGMHPRNYEHILGQCASCDLIIGTPMKEEYIQ